MSDDRSDEVTGRWAMSDVLLGVFELRPTTVFHANGASKRLNE